LTDSLGTSLVSGRAEARTAMQLRAARARDRPELAAN
jgi:hypothetical protein